MACCTFPLALLLVLLLLLPATKSETTVTSSSSSHSHSSSTGSGNILRVGNKSSTASCPSETDALCDACASVGAPACCDSDSCFAMQPHSAEKLAEQCQILCHDVVAGGWPSVHVDVTLPDTISTETLERYVSVDLDWWHNTTHDCDPAQGAACWGNSGALWLDLDHPHVRAAAKALAPGFLRVGGSLDNYVRYLVGDMTNEECHAPFGPVKGQMWPGLCLNMTRWAAIHRFAAESGLDLVFGLAHPNRLQWDSENALALLQHTAHQPGQRLYAVELGEEMAPFPGTAAFENMVHAYSNLRKGIHGIQWPSDMGPPLVLGPCEGMSNEEPGPGFAFMKAFLNRTLTQPKDGGSAILDAVVMHSYDNDAGDDWSRAGFLGQTLAQAQTMLAETRKHSNSAQLWCGECGPHNAGGLANLTDRFLSSFQYADALGGLAKLGLAQFGRQALVGSNYGLLREYTYEPNPDFYTAVAFSQLMGREVLNVTLDTELPTDALHVYAHCAADHKYSQHTQNSGWRGVTLLFINIHPTVSYKLALPVASSANSSMEINVGPRREWHFSAPDVYSQQVLLNGKPLELPLGGSTLPALEPKLVANNTAIRVEPLSYGFASLDYHRCPARNTR